MLVFFNPKELQAMLGDRITWRWRLCFSFVALVAIGSDRAWSNEATRTDEIKDLLEQSTELRDDSAEEMAREILQLQQQLGGSIVDERLRGEPLQMRSLPEAYVPPPRQLAPPDVTLLADPAFAAPWPQHRANHPAAHQSAGRHSSPMHSRVRQLRQVAWELDRAAHQLEELDLYEQADAIRAVATRLRRDARLMKQRGANAPSDNSRYSAPPTPQSDRLEPAIRH